MLTTDDGLQINVNGNLLSNDKQGIRNSRQYLSFHLHFNEVCKKVRQKLFKHISYFALVFLLLTLNM